MAIAKVPERADQGGWRNSGRVSRAKPRACARYRVLDRDGRTGGGSCGTQRPLWRPCSCRNSMAKRL